MTKPSWAPFSADVLASAAFVRGLSSSDFTKDELRDLKKPSGERKAVVAAVATVLRPGKSVQVSIADNRWVSSETAGLQGLAAVIEFVRGVLAFSED